MRFKSVLGILAVVLAVSILTNLSFAQKDGSKKETITCPVSGEKVIKSNAAGPYQYNGNEYYFCCNGCMEKFKQDPETYLNKTKDISCGMTVDKRTAQKVSYEGKDFYFCSEKCKEAFENDPKAHVMKVMKTSKVHVHDENCEGCDQCSGDKATKAGAKKECCGDKVKTEKKSDKKKI